MPLNLELKAHLPSFRHALSVAKRYGRFHARLVQKDTYFFVPEGRLKLRTLDAYSGEVIFYHRNERRGDRWSSYQLVKTDHPHELEKLLDHSLQTLVVVKKRRTVYRIRNARIHLDRVKNLGSFIEFEVMVTKGKPQAKKLLIELKKLFEIKPKDIVRGSYSDMLLCES